jgi:galactokinase
VATVAHRAETGFVGVACGIMDHTVSAHAAVGHALRIWCDTGRREQVPFDRTVLVFDTASPRNLRASEFNTRQAECATALAALRETDRGLSSLAGATMELVERTKLPTTVARRARHVVTENQRVEAFVRALRMGEPLGGLLFASHQSLRDDYECSTPELDWAVEQAMGASGIEGARLTGAGWGGCAIIVGGDDALRALDEPLRARFAERWRRTPRTWWSRAAAGAAVDVAPPNGARLSFGL